MHHRFHVFIFGGLLLPLSYSFAQTGPYALGAVETQLLNANKPSSISEVRKLQTAANRQITTQTFTQAAATLEPGEVTAITQAQPSNAQLNRTVKTSWTVFAYDVSTGLVVPNVNFTLGQLRHQPNSGGHDHDSVSRPKGELSAFSGNSGPTGLDLTIQYTSPDVSGKVYSDGSCAGPNGFSCFSGYYFSFTTQVPNLQRLDADQTFKLIGSTATHSSNHWGTTSFLAKLREAASMYFLKYEGLPEGQLAINDLSLEFGGLFDIGANWKPAHREHRIGVVGDLRVVPVEHISALRKIFRDVGIVGRVLIHAPPDAPHWHIREYDSRE